MSPRSGAVGSPFPEPRDRPKVWGRSRKRHIIDAFDLVARDERTSMV
jgi:hypothetical protein